MYKILILFLTLTTFQVCGQNNLADPSATETDKEKIPLSERLYYTGGLQFNVNDRFMLLGAAPNLGYKFNDIFSMGVGLSYQWYKYRNIELSTHNYGGKVFARGKLPGNILLATEYETVNFDNGFGSRNWRTSALAGVGYHVPQNNAVSMNFFFFYNLSFNQNNDLYGTEFVPRVEIAYNF